MKQSKIFFAFLILFLFSGCQQENQPDISSEKYCSSDSDCFPASCCHPDSCANQRPDCGSIMCTMECKPGTMDCGQGRCICQDNECKAIIEDN